MINCRKSIWNWCRWKQTKRISPDIPEWWNLFVWYGWTIGMLPLLIPIIPVFLYWRQYKRIWLLPIIVITGINGFFVLLATAFVLPYFAYMNYIYPYFRGYGMEPGILALVTVWLEEYWFFILLFSAPIIEIVITVVILKILLRKWHILEPILKFNWKQTADSATPS